MSETHEREERITVGEGDEAREIAARITEGDGPTLLWCGGYSSDMTGSKASEMVAFARERGLAAVRFDYSGHGASGGRFADGTISRWLEETVAVANAFTKGPLVVLGSSMGGWIALRLAQEIERIAGMVLIAPAPDFTHLLVEPSLTDEQREALTRDGQFTVPSQYGWDPYIYTAKLFEDGRDNLVLDKRLVVGAPVRILQGMEDPDVPHTHALRLAEALAEDDVVMTLVRDGDHRLSRDEDLARMRKVLGEVVDLAA